MAFAASDTQVAELIEKAQEFQHEEGYIDENGSTFLLLDVQGYAGAILFQSNEGISTAIISESETELNAIWQHIGETFQ